MTAIAIIPLLAASLFALPLGRVATAAENRPSDEHPNTRGAASAIVEYASPGAAALFDQFSPGDKIALSSGRRVVIDYFSSCAREEIVGGEVTVGADRSTVTHGTVHRQHVPCVADAEGVDSLKGLSFRGINRRSAAATVYRIFSRCPVVDLKDAETVTVERLDQAASPVIVAVDSAQVKNGFYDFATGACPFVAGGTYRLTAGSRLVDFQVDAAARRRAGAVVGRLLRM